MESFFFVCFFSVAFSTVLNKELSSTQTAWYLRIYRENKLIHGIPKMNYSKINATGEAGIRSYIAGSTFPANKL